MRMPTRDAAAGECDPGGLQHVCSLGCSRGGAGAGQSTFWTSTAFSCSTSFSTGTITSWRTTFSTSLTVSFSTTLPGRAGGAARHIYAGALLRAIHTNDPLRASFKSMYTPVDVDRDFLEHHALDGHFNNLFHHLRMRAR